MIFLKSLHYFRFRYNDSRSQSFAICIEYSVLSNYNISYNHCQFGVTWVSDRRETIVRPLRMLDYFVILLTYLLPTGKGYMRCFHAQLQWSILGHFLGVTEKHDVS